MKHIVFTFLMTLLFVSPNIAQEGSKKDKIAQFKALKVGYITQTLNLTPIEAEKFWPIYNEAQGKINKLRYGEAHKLRKKLKQDKELESISESEAQEILNQFIKIDSDILAEQNKMYKKLESVLSAKKILKLHQAEHDFNRKVLEQLKRKREGKERKE